MKGLDVVHPGEGNGVIAAVTLHDDRNFVVTQPVEGPIVSIRHVLDEIDGMTVALALDVDDGHAFSRRFQSESAIAVGTARAPNSRPTLRHSD